MLDKATIRNKVESFVTDVFGECRNDAGKTGDIDQLSAFRLDELQDDLAELIFNVIKNVPEAETPAEKEYDSRYSEVYSEVYQVRASSYEEGVKKLDAALRKGSEEGPRYCIDSSFEEV